MTDKSLKDKAIDIKGKDYVMVKDRILYFNETYPNGKIETQLVSDGDKIVVKAKVTPDCEKLERYFTGISASNPNKGIEAQVPHEVAETSAVGRALAMMGIGVIDSVASVDEMRKTSIAQAPKSPNNEFNNSKCQKCGAPIAISAQGKPYCSAKCWLK